jgi:hypothetical protein
MLAVPLPLQHGVAVIRGLQERGAVLIRRAGTTQEDFVRSVTS